MKKEAIYTSSFLIILVVLVLSIGEILEIITLNIDPNEPKIEKIFNLKNKDYTCLILGNSISQQAFNPHILDSILHGKSYNMAIGGSTIFESELILRQYINNNNKPNKILLGIYLNEKEWPDRVRPSVMENLDSQIIKDHIENNINLEKSNLNFYNIIKMFRYRNVIEHTLKFLYDKDRFNHSYENGFLIRKNIARPVTSHKPNVAGINIKAINSLINYCRVQKIELIFVELPNHLAFNKATTNRQRILKLFKSSIGNCEFIMLNKPSVYFDTDWAGLNHLNNIGANKFSKELATHLSRVKKP
ncbi:MAG: hypothetical protein HRT72_11725 [Flavobacteriales bacterium]|nr:hypothetical protein [Flavobacteriales bacterium]